MVYRGRTLLRIAAETAVATAPHAVFVVVGAQARRMREELAGLDVRIVENPDWEEGLGTSVRAGLAAAEALGPLAAVLFTACDQPGITPEYLRALVATYLASGAPVVACAYAGVVGVPALFDGSLFAELRALTGDAGARSVIDRHRRALMQVPCPGAVADVDTPEDVERLGRSRG